MAANEFRLQRLLEPEPTDDALSERQSEERNTASPAEASCFGLRRRHHSQRSNSDSTNSGGFSEGDHATIIGLTVRPELNDRHGTVQQYVIDTKRYGVKVEGAPKL